MRSQIVQYGSHHRLLCCHCPSCRVRSEGEIVGEGHAPCGISDGGLNMKITEVTIRPTNDGVVRACVDIVFDTCLMIRDIKVIQGATGLFLSFPAKKQRDGTHRQLAYPGNIETRMMIQRIITGGVRTNLWKRPHTKRSLSFQTSKST